MSTPRLTSLLAMLKPRHTTIWDPERGLVECFSEIVAIPLNVLRGVAVSPANVKPLDFPLPRNVLWTKKLIAVRWFNNEVYTIKDNIRSTDGPGFALTLRGFDNEVILDRVPLTRFSLDATRFWRTMWLRPVLVDTISSVLHMQVKTSGAVYLQLISMCDG